MLIINRRTINLNSYEKNLRIELLVSNHRADSNFTGQIETKLSMPGLIIIATWDLSLGHVDRNLCSISCEMM